MATSMVARRQLANEIRRIRLDSTDHTIGTVAEALGWNKAKVSRIETARVAVSRPDLLRLCVLYELADADVARLEQILTQGADDTEWWRGFGDSISSTLAEYIALESQASAITIASASTVPGLLQTGAYMEAITSGSPFVTDPEARQSVVEVRTRRQSLLLGESPPAYTAVLSPAMLYLQPGGPEILKGQLLRLLESSEAPGITIQMLPHDSPAVCFMGTITSFDFADARDAGVVAVEHQGGMAFKDSARDIRRFRRTVRYLRDQALSPDETRKVIHGRLKEL